jgi:hypothetical protein
MLDQHAREQLIVAGRAFAKDKLEQMEGTPHYSAGFDAYLNAWLPDGSD